MKQGELELRGCVDTTIHLTPCEVTDEAAINLVVAMFQNARTQHDEKWFKSSEVLFWAELCGVNMDNLMERLGSS